jgi:hypothetical protein
MSQIIEALKKIDRENAPRRLGWGPIATEVLKPGQLRPPKRILRYIIYILLTSVVTTSLIYGVTVKSGFLWKSTSPASGIPPAPGPQVFQIPRDVADAQTPLPTAPAKSPEPVQKPAPPSPEAGSLAKSSPSKSPTQDLPARKSAPPPIVSRFLPKASPLPPAQPSAPGEEDSEAASQNTQSDSPSSVDPGVIEEVRKQRALQRAYRDYQRSLQTERRTPASPGAEGLRPPPFIPQAPGPSPLASLPAVPPSPNASAGALPQLKISGIIWNGDPAKRRAVVNGSFVTEGDQIEGAKVVEILPISVRFSYKNQGFEISAFD